MNAVLVISHGSQSAKTKQEVELLIKRLKEKINETIIEYAFLELETPSIPEGIKNCIDKGANHVYVLLNFLNSGKHVDKDIPEIINAARQKYPTVKISISKPIGQHKSIVDLFAESIQFSLKL